MNEIKIGRKKIGVEKPCFIIAEAGVNHNGKVELAKKLIDVAVDAGVDAVKFQTFKTEGVVTKQVDAADYAKKNMGKDIKQIDLIKKLELPYEDFKDLKKYCDKKKIIFLSTPHSFDAIDFLDEIIPAFKFGSGDLTNIPALKYAAKKGKPMILGAGMATLEEIKDSVNEIKKTGNNQIIVLHCTTNYPCPYEEVNMNAMNTMQKELDCMIGYSDHTIGNTIPIMAVSRGAVMIEKHFTLDKNLSGPDHKASLEPDELKRMVTKIRNVEKAKGIYKKKPTKSEEKIMKIVRKSIVFERDAEKGEIITKDMLIIKRPGTGLNPKDMEEMIGRKLKKDVKKDQILNFTMVE